MVSATFIINPDELNKALKDRIIEEAEQIFTDSQENIVEQNIVDRGSLLASGKLTIGDDSVEIKYDTLYADVIEFGRLPGSMPPVSKIQEWVERKGLNFKDKRGKPMTSRQIAFIIAKDIEVNGTEPRPYLGPAVEKARLRLTS